MARGPRRVLGLRPSDHQPPLAREHCVMGATSAATSVHPPKATLACPDSFRTVIEAPSLRTAVKLSVVGSVDAMAPAIPASAGVRGRTMRSAVRCRSLAPALVTYYCNLFMTDKVSCRAGRHARPPNV